MISAHHALWCKYTKICEPYKATELAISHTGMVVEQSGEWRDAKVVIFSENREKRVEIFLRHGVIV